MSKTNSDSFLQALCREYLSPNKWVRLKYWLKRSTGTPNLPFIAMDLSKTAADF